MSFNYSGMAATAQRLVQQFGRAITVRKPTVTANDADIPSDVTVTYTDYSVTGAVIEYRADQIDGTQIMAQDRMCLIAGADLSVAPEPDWRVVDDSKTYTVIEVERTGPGGTEVLYTLHLRA